MQFSISKKRHFLDFLVFGENFLVSLHPPVLSPPLLFFFFGRGYNSISCYSCIFYIFRIFDLYYIYTFLEHTKNIVVYFTICICTQLNAHMPYNALLHICLICDIFHLYVNRSHSYLYMLNTLLLTFGHRIYS